MGRMAAQGINSFKFFMAYKGTLQITDEELIAGFQRSKQLGAIPMVTFSSVSLTPPQGLEVSSRGWLLETRAIHQQLSSFVSFFLQARRAFFYI